MSQDQSFITAEGLNKLKEELTKAKLSRKDIAIRIQDAKELGDLSENAEYAEAKNTQAFNEGRIMEIENILNNSVIITEVDNNGQVQVGSSVKVLAEGQKVERIFKIVGSNEADPASGIISNESPLGQAFLGQMVGKTVEVQVPKGTVRYKIISVE